MFGWIHDCTESLVVTKFGLETWHKIKEEAGCDIEDGGFLRYRHYSDDETIGLVQAASKVTGLGVDDVLGAFGDYFVQYVQDNGYSNVLKCLGNNLRDWLSNLNALHDHLQSSYPKGFIAPVFWSHDDKDHEGALVVQYSSKRGSLLVPLVVGLIKKIATEYFDIEINMELLQLQGDTPESRHTSWRVTAKDPELAYKLRGEKRGAHEDNSESETMSMRYGSVFREGGKQAADLRVEEFVKRCFHNPESELYHALTTEHFTHLVAFWQSNHIDGLWCYDRWPVDDSGETKEEHEQPTLDDVLEGLQNTSLGIDHPPETGRYPPDESGNLQNLDIPLLGMPIVCPHFAGDENVGFHQALGGTEVCFRVENRSVGEDVEFMIEASTDVSLEVAIRNASASLLESWSEADMSAVKRTEAVQQCVVWDNDANDEYHTFSLDELATTTTQQLIDLLPLHTDIVRLILMCKEVKPVEEDEEDI